jgi:mitogen-activated protein kinase 1/3
VISVLGTPTSEDMQFIGNDLAKKYVRSLPKKSRQSLIALYPNANPLGLDLL